jgi:hypothetical protein
MADQGLRQCDLTPDRVSQGRQPSVVASQLFILPIIEVDPRDRSPGLLMRRLAQPLFEVRSLVANI